MRPGEISRPGGTSAVHRSQVRAMPRAQSLNLMAVGGGAKFDPIVLARTTADLPPPK